MSVDVEHGSNARVTEARCDHGWVHALLDEKGYVAVSKVVESHGFANRLNHSGLPDSASEVGRAEEAALG